MTKYITPLSLRIMGETVLRKDVKSLISLSSLILHDHWCL